MRLLLHRSLFVGLQKDAVIVAMIAVAAKLAIIAIIILIARIAMIAIIEEYLS